MRRILVEHARRRGRSKRGGGAIKIAMDEAKGAGSMGEATDVLALHEALDKLALAEPEKTQVVELRFFGGLDVKETASVLGLGERTIERYWLYGRTGRQLLAQLEHPNIARLLDGGTTEQGVPYLVMEHVEGLPIDRHCQQLALGLIPRLRLFLEVCGAGSTRTAT